MIKFRLPPTEWSEADLRRAYITGPDRTPTPGQVELRNGVLLVRRSSSESGRLVVPWPVEGSGIPVLNTATLTERFEPYDLTVELARGTLNDVQNQVSDWQLVGLAVSTNLECHLKEARHSFAEAATARDQPAKAHAAAESTLRHAVSAGRLLVESYSAQLLEKRLDHSRRLQTLLAIDLDGMPKTKPWSAPALEAINAARVQCTWSALVPDSGRYRWEISDAQLSWCRKRHLTPTAGPLIDLRPGAMPDWLWLWAGDFDQILAQAIELVRNALGRYKGKVGIWHLVHRPASQEILGLSEEEQVRLTARLVQVARQVDPDTHLVVDFDRPWADWMSTANFQLGPLHLADSLARAELGLSGIGVEIAPSFTPWGSPLRELFEFSRLLDLFALVNLPLHISLAFPSSVPEGAAAGLAQVDARQWPRLPDEQLQRDWTSRWLSLAVAKPFVRSVTWLEPSDTSPRLYPASGLFRADGSPKPAFSWLRQFRREMLSPAVAP